VPARSTGPVPARIKAAQTVFQLSAGSDSGSGRFARPVFLACRIQRAPATASGPAGNSAFKTGGFNRPAGKT
jgi:hypothetical protein